MYKTPCLLTCRASLAPQQWQNAIPTLTLTDHGIQEQALTPPLGGIHCKGAVCKL